MAMIKTSFDRQIGTIALDNYAKRNSLSAAMIAEIITAFDRFKTAAARAVVIRSASGEKVWSSGHAVDELPAADVDPLPYSDPLEQLLRAVKSFPAPVIAMVHGSVWGGACDLVMACDLVVADDTSMFAITPAKLGLPYNIDGFLNFMSRIPLAIVKEMFFTAEPISAARAERAGLVNQIVPAAELEAFTYAMAAKIAERSPAAIAAFKKAIRALSEAVALNPETYEYLQGLRREVYHGRDYREGIEAFMQKRSPKF
ncbi:MAG TPA: methylmalonyl-CoA decarboxylase [Candidatus Binataceae bacterium]|nr:methylmalonyl-CoA decarboxylase [Candidatus Binataceae bacterium]